MVQARAQQRRLAKLNPVFPNDYLAEDYDRPDLIIIEDEDSRKGIEECEGAIGWLDNTGEIEVLHMYLEWVPNCGLEFSKKPDRDMAFYVDLCDPNRFIELESYASIARRDMNTELMDIAFCLGATECGLTYEETTAGTKKGRASGKALGKIKAGNNIAASGSLEVENAFDSSVHTVFYQTFTGVTEPHRPELRWYEGNLEVERLIKTALQGGTSEYQIEISETYRSALSRNLAGKLDATLVNSFGKQYFKGALSLSDEYEKQMSKKFVYKVKF